MFKKKTIVGGFSVVVLLLVGISSFGLFQLQRMSDHVEKIYRHPFTVNNAARTIEADIIAIHRHLNDAVLAKNNVQLQKSITQINNKEQSVLEAFDIIFDRFLGDKRMVQKTYKLFIDWKPIRDEALHLAREGDIQAATRVTQERGSAHLADLNEAITQLVAFAHNKAAEFHGKAKLEERQSLSVLLLTSIMAVTGSIFIAVYVVRSMGKVDKQTAIQQHLIDQNIMMASLDLDGRILDISNAMCRFLESYKAQLIGKQSHFFDNSDERASVEEDIIRTVRSGQAWEGEVQRICLDGKYKWANLSVIPNFDEHFKPLSYAVLAQDTTSKKLSGTDKLTAMLNRRRYDEILEHEIRLAKRHDTELTLAIADIDHFKAYNDTYGHPAGDEVLTKVAETILSCMHRPNDYAFRIGGEEFAILFAEQGRDASRSFLETIRTKVEALGIEHSGSKTASVLTISIGACVATSHQTLHKEALYSLADEALYLAKNDRNTVALHNDQRVY